MKIKYRYTYRLTRLSDGAFYIGSRSAASCSPEEDFGTHYFTSGVLEKEFRANPKQFTWVILSEDYADGVAMQEDEQRLIHESWDEPGRMNRSAYPVKFAYDEEWREKNVKVNRLKAKDPLFRENLSKAATKRVLRPEGRAHLIAASLKAQAPAARKKMSEAAKKRVLSPEGRAQMIAASLKSQTPVTRKRMSESATKREARKRAARQANENTLPFD